MKFRAIAIFVLAAGLCTLLAISLIPAPSTPARVGGGKATLNPIPAVRPGNGSSQSTEVAVADQSRGIGAVAQRVTPARVPAASQTTPLEPSVLTPGNSTDVRPFDAARGRPFDAAPGGRFEGTQASAFNMAAARAFNGAQGRPFDVAQGRREEGGTGTQAGLPVLGSLQCHLDAQTGLNAAEILQDCINRAPASGTVEIPRGRYVLQRRLVVSQPLTLRTVGSSSGAVSCVAAPDECAILMAAPDLFDPYGLLLVHKTSDVVVEHVVLDGNRSERLSSPAAQSCQRGRNTTGFNAAFIGCAKCALQDVVSRNALCGSGMVWSGAEAIIQRNEFSTNGDATIPGMWADGLTVVYAPHAFISFNRFVDNSDVALIVGYGRRSSIERNVIVQRTRSAFAGLMLHNFNSNNLGTRGDFRGSEVKYNTVDCGFQLCVFGIQLGPWPWDPTQNIIGGEVHDNEVRGAKVGINADGAGVVGYPMAIFANTVLNVPSGAYFSNCARPILAEWMNVSPTSVVDRRDEAVPAGAQLSDPCQLYSSLARAIP